jgi:membrane-associated protease RseP (regulator of RpoE activity)
MTNFLLSTALAVSMLAAQKSSTDCLSYFPSGESFGFSSDEMSGHSSYLGVDTRDVTPDRMSALQLKEEQGVEVTMVDQDAPAGKAGIKEHDVILTVNKEPVQSVEQLRRMIHEIPSGRVVEIGLSRNGQSMTVKAQLADRKSSFAFVGPDMKAFKFTVPAIPAVPVVPDVPQISVVMVHSSMRSGLMVENLTPQLGAFFGAKGGEGVLVRSVEKGSAAERAGFRAGDVIVKVNGQSVTDTGDFSRTLRIGKDNTASVGIIRDKKEQNLTLTLPDRKQGELESMDDEDIDVDALVNLEGVRSQVAALKPEMLKYAEMMKQLKPEMEKIQKESVEHANELREQMQEMQEDLKQQEEDFRQQQEDYQELIQEKLSGPRADI